MAFDFEKALRRKIDQHTALVERKNKRVKDGNGVFDRWAHPVLTAAHTPLFWRYDLDPRRNPLLLERLGVNAVFNVGAIEWNGKVCLVAPSPSHKWAGGMCNFATHRRVEIKLEELKINPLKASKKAAGGKKK